MPARAATPGQTRLYYRDEGKHMRGVLCVRNAQGQWVPVAEHRASYPVVQQAIARAEGDQQLSELGFDELGGKLMRKIKTVAKKVVKSKALGTVLKAGAAITAVVPGVGTAASAGLLAASAAQTMAQKAIKAKEAAQKGVKAAKGLASKPKPKAKAAAPRTTAARPSPLKSSPLAKAAKLRAARSAAAARAVAQLPEEEQPAALQKAAVRMDSYKVLTPSGETIFVGPEALGL